MMKNFTEKEASIIAKNMTTKAVADGKLNDEKYAYPYAVGALESMITRILCGDENFCTRLLNE